MSVTPIYLVEEGQRKQTANIARVTDETGFQELQSDAAAFKKAYFHDVQRIFSRVQHHMHKRTKTGWVPLKACQRSGVKNCTICKQDFPKSNLLKRKSVLVCRGVAKKLKLPITGKRNAFGSMSGRRTCQWHSGTTPSFAVGFRSNSHSMLNWRLPPSHATHADDLCRSAACRNSLGS